MQKLLNLINNSNYLVALTGAGISTLSGIKDFRGKNGINKTVPGQKIFDLGLFYQNPSFYYEHTRNFIYNLDDKEPNIVHRTLAKWEQEGLLKAVITQNIDLLHQKAGSKNVIEIHGSPAVHHCIKCCKNYTFEDVQDQLRHVTVPHCDACGGILKPDITFYGEPLPSKALDLAVQACERCDCLLVLGSSLVVYPAADLPNIALDHGAKLIIVNEQPTHLDGRAVLKYEDLGDVFRALNKKTMNDER
jgi:NAD-dependent deacetylase